MIARVENSDLDGSSSLGFTESESYRESREKQEYDEESADKVKDLPYKRSVSPASGLHSYDDDEFDSSSSAQLPAAAMINKQDSSSFEDSAALSRDFNQESISDKSPTNNLPQAPLKPEIVI